MKWSNHTTNLIDAKIESQSILIMDNFFGTFFDARLALKGRFWSISCKNSWLTCFNGCTIESRKQENHEELKIFLQNRLISSRFDQKLGLRRKNIGFYKKFHRKNCGPSDFVKDDSMAEIAWFKWATIPRFFCHDCPPFLKGIKSKKSGKCLKNQNKI